MDTNNDWRDGFLFLGNRLCLDFLNTRPVMNDEPVELLADNAALGRWLRAAGYDAPEWSGTQDLGELQTFREQLREAVQWYEAGKQIPEHFITRLNALLQVYPLKEKLSWAGDAYQRGRAFHPQRPVEAFTPILEDILTLLTSDAGKVRKCDGCELHFQDTSKKGLRRWCSMSICGNRAKVAAYARRRKAQ